MKKGISFGVYLLLCSVAVWGREKVVLEPQGDGYCFNFILSSWEIRAVDTLGLMTPQSYGGAVFNLLSVLDNDYVDDGEIGNAELPALTFVLAIQNLENLPTFEVFNKVEEEITVENQIYPKQIPWPKSQPLSERPFSYNKHYYASVITSNPLIQVNNTYSFRGVPCAVIKVTPFTYSPSLNKIKVLRSGTIKIKTSTAPIRADLQSKTFESLLKSVIVNYELVVCPNPEVNPKENYLIITAPDYEAKMKEYATFREKRFKVTLANTSTAGATGSAIQSYIKKLYESPETKPTYVLLVGDVNKIPANPTSPTSDFAYGHLTGALAPEVLCGRFSVGNAEDLNNIIAKSMFMEEKYNSLPKGACFVAGTDGGGNWKIGEGTMNYSIDTYFTAAGYKNQKRYCVTYKAKKDQVVQDLTDGMIFHFFSGHGSGTGTSAIGFNVSVIRSLTNDKSYPFSSTFACFTGGFSSGECMSEAWIRAKSGAVCSFASSISSNWGPDDKVQRGMIDAYKDSINIFSASCAKGLIKNNSTSYAKQYNLMGDPAMSCTKSVVTTTPIVDPGFDNYPEGDRIIVSQLRNGKGLLIRTPLMKVEGKAQIRIFNPQGKCVYQAIAADKKEIVWKVPVESMTASGMYIISIAIANTNNGTKRYMCSYCTIK